jgi:hypothetical protein
MTIPWYLKLEWNDYSMVAAKKTDVYVVQIALLCLPIAYFDLY